MEKPYKFTELSDKKCVVCGTHLKKNLIAKKTSANKCYKCFKGKITNIKAGN